MFRSPNFSRLQHRPLSIKKNSIKKINRIFVWNTATFILNSIKIGNSLAQKEMPQNETSSPPVNLQRKNNYSSTISSPKIIIFQRHNISTIVSFQRCHLQFQVDRVQMYHDRFSIRWSNRETNRFSELPLFHTKRGWSRVVNAFITRKIYVRESTLCPSVINHWGKFKRGVFGIVAHWWNDPLEATYCSSFHSWILNICIVIEQWFLNFEALVKSSEQKFLISSQMAVLSGWPKR